MDKIFLITNVASIVFAIGAVVAICNGVEHGWGWLIFAAVICHSTNSSKGNA